MHRTKEVNPMKKPIALLLIFACFLAFAGCNSVKPQNTTTPSQSSVPTTTPTTTSSTVPPTTSGWEIVMIGSTREGYDLAVEELVVDGKYICSFPAIMSPYIYVLYRNGTSENIKDAISAGRATVTDLARFGVPYMK